MLGENKLTNSELVWYGVIFWAVVLTAVEATFSFAFNTNLQVWQVYSDIIIGLIFTADLVYDLIKRSQEKATNLSHKEDWKFWALMAVNVVACIPFDAIAYIFSIKQGIEVIKIIRLIRLVRIGKIFSLLNSFTLIPKSIKIQIYCVLSIVVLHFLACCWGMIYPPDTKDLTEYYVKCFYWAVTTLTTIGYGDITPTTLGGRLFTMLVMIVGVGVYGIIIGNFAQIFAESARHKEQAKEKLQELQLFMRHYNIPVRIQEAAFNYYKHLMTKRLSDNDQKIISDLPQALQHELQTYMNMKLISNLPVFKECSTACLKDVAAALEQQFYSPGRNIIQIGEVGQEMYIIGHGVVEVILKDGNVVASLHEGQFFGEAALLEETTRNASVRAQTYCDLYKLPKDKFLEIIKTHNELLENMEKVAKKRSTDKRSATSKEETTQTPKPH